MNGVDMMVNAILKATGFDREDFDKGVATAKSKAVDFEKRFAAMESNLVEILPILHELREHARLGVPLLPETPRAADAQDTDHAG